MKDAVDIAKNVVVPKAEDANTYTIQILRTRSILFRQRFPSMSSAVELDNEPRLVAVEVGDVTADRDLPAEFRASEPTVAQGFPECSLSVGTPAPQGARLIEGVSKQLCSFLFHAPHPDPLPEGEGEPPFLPAAFRSSNSSRVFGQSPLSSCDRARSARSLPPVWQAGQ